MIDLILKDVADRYVRENFYRIRKYFGNQVILDGNFSFFDVAINAADNNLKIPHGLDFSPLDIIQLSAIGNQNFNFKYHLFDSTNIVVAASGPVRIRFLAGKMPTAIGTAEVTFPYVART